LLKMNEEEHKRYHRKLIYIFIVMLMILFGGGAFYHYMEGWRFLDALYFSAYTMTTVGYGDFVPKTDAGKIFTIIYVFTGVGVALYGLSLLSSHFVEVREEFWLERIGKIKLRQHSQTVWDKLSTFFNYRPEKIVEEQIQYNKPAKKKKQQ